MDVGPTRARVRSRFAAVLNGNATLARQLEVVHWNNTLKTAIRDSIPRFWAKKLRYRYTTKALGLEGNIKNPKNTQLRARLLSGELGVRDFVAMTPQEMFPELYDEVYSRITLRDLRRTTTTDHRTAPDGAYTCRRRGSKKTVYSAVQIRSADEPMTIFVSCLACKRNWKD